MWCVLSILVYYMLKRNRRKHRVSWSSFDGNVHMCSARQNGENLEEETVKQELPKGSNEVETIYAHKWSHMQKRKYTSMGLISAKT